MACRTCLFLTLRTPAWNRAFLSAAALFVVSVTLAQVAPDVPQPPAAADDVAWARLTGRLPSREHPAGRGTSIDWAVIAAEAASFRRDFPDHAGARAAEKLELMALIRTGENQPELSAQTVARVQAFLDDKGHPPRDRLELTIAFEQAKFRRTAYPSRSERLQAQAAHARGLIKEFPDQPEGYGYQLSLAKAESAVNARRLAEELLAMPVPEATKTGAQRVLARLNLVSQPFTLDGAEVAIGEAEGHSLVVYSWARKDGGFLEIIRRLTGFADVRFIGVNLDQDESAARVMAADLRLPGTQLYDRAGLDGPAARQLHLTMTASLYIVDGNGVVRFVNGHQDPPAKLTQLALEKGFQP